jgi:hypothetical protein
VFLAWRDNGTLVYIQIHQFKTDAGGSLVVLMDTFRTGTADVDGLKRMAIDQYHRLP